MASQHPHGQFDSEENHELLTDAQESAWPLVARRFRPLCIPVVAILVFTGIAVAGYSGAGAANAALLDDTVQFGQIFPRMQQDEVCTAGSRTFNEYDKCMRAMTDFDVRCMDCMWLNDFFRHHIEAKKTRDENTVGNDENTRRHSVLPLQKKSEWRRKCMQSNVQKGQRSSSGEEFVRRSTIGPQEVPVNAQRFQRQSSDAQDAQQRSHEF